VSQGQTQSTTLTNPTQNTPKYINGKNTRQHTMRDHNVSVFKFALKHLTHYISTNLHTTTHLPHSNSHYHTTHHHNTKEPADAFLLPQIIIDFRTLQALLANSARLALRTFRSSHHGFCSSTVQATHNQHSPVSSCSQQNQFC